MAVTLNGVVHGKRIAALPTLHAAFDRVRRLMNPADGG
jgi:hypothetical protein